MLEDRELGKYDYITFMDKMMERPDDDDGYVESANGHYGY